MSRQWRYVYGVGRLHVHYRLPGSIVVGQSFCGFERGQAYGVRRIGICTCEIGVAGTYHVEPIVISAVVCGWEIVHPKLVVSHVEHDATGRNVIHIACRVDADVLSRLRHSAVEILASGVNATQFAHSRCVNHAYGLLISVIFGLRAVSSRIGNVEPAVVVGNAFRLVAHMTGVYYLLCAQVDFSHIALVGIRCYVEKSLAVGSQTAVVGNVFGSGYRRAVRSDILYYVRPVDADGYQRVVNVQYVVARIAQMLARILLLEPSVGQYSMVDERQRRVVHAPQSLAQHNESVGIGCRLIGCGIVGRL